MVAAKKRALPHIDPRHLPEILTPAQNRVRTAMLYAKGRERDFWAKTYREMGFGDWVEQYAFSPVGPVNVHVSVPLTNFATAFAMDRTRFMVETLCPTAIVDKVNGKYWRFDAPEGYRIENDDEDNYAPGRGGGRPKEIEMEAQVADYEAKLRALSSSISEVAQANADFAIKNRVARFLTTQLQIRKAKRLFDLLTDGTSLTTFADTTALTGGANPWDAATTANSSIKKTINAAVRTIELNTFNSVDASNLWMVFNPVMAGQVATQLEVIDHVKQSVSGERMLLGESPFSNATRYGLPATLFGINVMIASTAIVTGPKDIGSPATGGTDYLMGDAEVLFINAEPPSLDSLSTATAFTFEPFTMQDHHIAPEHINNIQVLNNYDLKITSSASGVFLQDANT